MANTPDRRSVFDSSKNFLALPALLLAGVALLAGCHPAVKTPAVTDPKDPKFIVAERGNWQITRGELDKETAAILKQHRATPEQVGPEMMLQLDTSTLKDMVLTKLVVDKAAALPLKDVDKDEAAMLDTAKQSVPPGQNFEQLLKTYGLSLDDVKKQIHERVLVHKVLETEVFKNDDPTEQEINDFYLKNKATITTSPQVRASRILVHVDNNASAADKALKKKAIDKAHARVAHGEDFGKVAMEVSEDQSSKSKGGDLGFFQRGENEPGFDEVAFNTKQGAMSPVFPTLLGYQFLKVTDTKPAGVIPLAEVRPKIAAYLRDLKMQNQLKAYKEKLLADSGVTYHITMVEPPAPNAAAGPGAPNSAPPSAAPAAAVSTPPIEAPPAATNSAPSK